MIETKTKINAEKWIIKVVSTKEMAKISDDKHTSGLCVAYEKIIYLREDSIDYVTVAHELYHGYFSYLCLSSTTDISLSDSEEIAAEFHAAKGETMVKHAKQLTKKLLKLHKELEE